MISETGEYTATSLPSGAYALSLPAGDYLIYQLCGGTLIPVDFPNFTVPVNPGEDTGDIYLATCP